VIRNDLTLYTHNGISYSEPPRVAGGSIVPVRYIEGAMGDMFLDVMVGGFNATVLDWNNETTMAACIVGADDALDQYGLELLIVDILAYDDDKLVEDENSASGVDFAPFEIYRDGTVRYYGDDPSGVGSVRGSSVGTLSAAYLCGLSSWFGALVWNGFLRACVA
jgi:hypothetical protein